MGRRTSSLYYCGRRRRWFYALVVTGAATFLATLPFVAQRLSVFQAEAYVLPPSSALAPEPSAATQLAAELPNALPAVAQRVTGQPWSEPELKALASAISIQTDGAFAKDNCLSLAIEWDDATLAEQLVRGLAEQLCERKNKDIPAPASVSHEAATATRQCTEILRDEAREEVAELKQIIAEHDKRAAAPSEVIAPKKVPVLTTAVNPAWASMKRDLEKLDAQRLKMLELYTAEHPLIANLTAQRDELEARLAQIPQQIEAPHDVAPQEKAPSDTKPAISEALIAENNRRRVKLAKLERELADAEERVRQAVQDEQNSASAIAAPDPRWWLRGSRAAEARVGSRVFAPLDWLGMVSLLAGSVIALGVVGIRPRYESAAEALARLPVPVVGIIPADEPLRRPASIRRWAARLVGVCEWVLVAAILFLALAVWKDPVFGQRLIADPLTVLATPADWVPWLRQYAM
jgi:hypothetical protein